MIECPAVLINGIITNDKEYIRNKIKYGDYLEFKFINRAVFSFMEACDLWRDRMLSKKPTIYKFTEKQWEDATRKGLTHG